jgi:hypothetical protein
LSTQLVVTVITHGGDLEQHGPGGFLYVDQVFEEAGLRDATDALQAEDFRRRLRILERALRREFGSRVSMRALSPWTLRGLWFIVRHRLRDFPCLVIAGQRYPLEASVGEVAEAVRLALP